MCFNLLHYKLVEHFRFVRDFIFFSVISNTFVNSYFRYMLYNARHIKQVWQISGKPVTGRLMLLRDDKSVGCHGCCNTLLGGVTARHRQGPP